MFYKTYAIIQPLLLGPLPAVRVKGKPVRVAQNTCVPHGQPCPPRSSGAVVNRAINYSMSDRECTGSKGACLSTTDER
jgi:hypothetical protein